MRSIDLTRRAAASLIVLALVGCATPRRVAVCPAAWSGRIAVTQGDAQHGLYGNFRLQLGKGGGSFDLLSPLGQTLAQARWNEARAQVDDGHGVREFASFEAMAQATIGLPLPRAALQDWVRGEPSAALPSTPLADGGFAQLGWDVRVEREAGRVRLLRASRATGEPARVSLVFDASCAQVK
ncbi:outer-membrane lipoprotein LolB [mine drainage metagenome]|jgi:outer membrane lipoprotein LolB|uniref:Outer-membrane lipoprotein LolB n=1 Tax=mine drainage metagenome TaxID=410659 RepID=A0A1J5PZV2_9ZZZZ